jgi:spore coat polysaccharide biosynthesis protein SpsF (cytidylyltransferase family)
MKLGVLILARLGSKRLPDKHLIEVKQRKFIEWLVGRFAHAFGTEIEDGKVSIIIATSEKGPNAKFKEIFADGSAEVFFGADENIPLRQLQCAKYYSLDAILSVDGDDLLCSTTAARIAFNALSAGKAAVKTSGLPLGLNLMGYTTKFLEACLREIPENDRFETGWGRIFSGKIEDISIPVQGSKDYNFLRFTLDYEADAQFFARIIDIFGEKLFEISDQVLINTVIDMQIYKLNSSLNDTYHDNFNSLMQAESKENESKQIQRTLT